MRKIVCTLLILCAFLNGCSLMHKDYAERAIQYAQENTDLLISAAAEALQAAEDLNAALVFPNNETSVLFTQYSDRDSGILQESTILPAVFSDGVIELIQVRENTVEFSCGGAGIGSNTTYSQLIYTESGVPEDIFWYDARMTYTEENGGFSGILPGSDNTVFYYKITDNLYYFEAHF
ncbi:MAG: hypothetical protein IJJ99_01215 [Oscillospiraceae bacterium]|nr:hypothetical protein [Oscillospiraceae bacterium]